MDDDNEITWIGIAFLLLKFVGAIGLIVVPIYLIYRVIKWLFD